MSMNMSLSDGSTISNNTLFDNIKMFTGMTDKEIENDLAERTKILNYLVNHNIDEVDGVGRIMAEYYTDKENLMRYINQNKEFPTQ